MKRIKGFSSFNESVALQMINETVLYFLPEMKNALNYLANSGDSIARQLLAKSKTDTQKDITMVDLEGERLSFMSHGAVNAQDSQLMYDIWTNSRNIADEDLANRVKGFPNRSQIKIGKFITSILGPIPQKEIEEFVNKLKSASLSDRNKGYEIKTVKGDEIKKYYRTEAMSLDNPNGPAWSSALGQSCMRDKEKTKPNVFDIYTENPDSCRLLVMLNDKGQLESRALLWKVSRSESADLPESFWFMDRIYSSKEWMNQSMKDWAVKNGIALRRNNWSGQNRITLNGVESKCDMEVDVRKIGYKGFPYMDTFTYYDVKNGKLRNFDAPGFQGFGLQSTTGEYGTTTGHGPVIRNYIRRFIK